MADYHGDLKLGDTIDVKFTTDVNGAPTTLAGTPAVAAYPDNSTTEITAGITLTVDFDTRTGLHNVRVIASSANGYAVGTNYALVVTAGTVGGVSIAGQVIGAFSVQHRTEAVFARAFSAAYGSLTFDELVKLMAAALVAKCSGMGTTTGTFRNLADDADVIVATIDADGNRSAVTRTP